MSSRVATQLFLLKACRRGDVNIVKYILENTEVTPNYMLNNRVPILEAVASRNRGVVLILSQHGAQLSKLPRRVYQQSEIGMSPMCLATKNEDLDMIKYLSILGVNPGIPDPDRLPIYYAIKE